MNHYLHHMRKIYLIVCLAVLSSQTNIFAQQIRLNKNNIDEVITAMTLEEKVRMVIGCGMSMDNDAKFPGTAGRTYDIPRLGIPSVYMADGPHRLAMSVRREFDSQFYYTTEFPSGTTVAATFNPDAAYRVGKTLGTEVKDYGMDILLASRANLMRNVLCLNGLEISDRESQPWTIMTACNKVNGKYTSENRELTTDILRDEWGVKGSCCLPTTVFFPLRRAWVR
jgi:beta-glucosidase-like glycosyl hydrolase